MEGQNIVIEYWWAEGKIERLSDFASELVRLKVDIVVTQTTPAAQEATTTIPIVMATAGDPVGTRLVASLPRPGGNVTGLSLLSRELMEKRSELLKQAVPNASRVAFLANSAIAPEVLTFKEIQGTALALGVTLRFVDVVTNPTDFEGAFVTMARERADALIVVESATNREHRSRIADLVSRHRLPTVSGFKEFAEAGGLIAYGQNFPDLFRRAATYVDKILKGAKPADLPTEQPTKFELVINLKTAKALGLTIPPSLLVRADQLIE